MAVTIEQMDINLGDTPAPPSATPAESQLDAHIDLQGALEMLDERRLRLQAD